MSSLVAEIKDNHHVMSEFVLPHLCELFLLFNNTYFITNSWIGLGVRW